MALPLSTYLCPLVRNALGLFVIFLVVVGIQLVYLSVMGYGLTKAGKQPRKPHPVSVIVCAHDEEQNLRELIPLLLAQDHPEFEIIVVEDRCNDGTYDYLYQETQHHARLRMVRVVHKPDHIQGKKFGLTLGIKAARYEWLVLTDADCRPSSNHWLYRMSECYDENTQIVLGFSPYQKSNTWLNALIRFESLLTGILYMAWAKLGKPYMGVGRNLAYTKSLFLNNKGFHEHLEVVGGDDDLFVNRWANRFNTTTVTGTDAITLSKPKERWRDFFHQKLRHLSVGKYYRFSDKLLLSLFSFSWLLTWCLLPAIYFAPYNLVLLSLFFTRWIALSTVMHQGSRQLGGTVEIWKVPVLDIIFAFYYLVTGLRALVVKRVKWKN